MSSDIDRMALKENPKIWPFIKKRLNDPQIEDHYINDLLKMQIACNLEDFSNMSELYKDYITKHISTAKQTYVPVDIIDQLVAEKSFWWKAPVILHAIYQTLVLQDMLPDIIHQTLMSNIDLIIQNEKKVQELVLARDKSETDEEKKLIEILFQDALCEFNRVVDESIKNVSDCVYEEIIDPTINKLVSHITL
jgi:hypothetical protein